MKKDMVCLEKGVIYIVREDDKSREEKGLYVCKEGGRGKSIGSLESKMEMSAKLLCNERTQEGTHLHLI